MDYIKVIDQNGAVACPFCQSQNKWELEVNRSVEKTRGIFQIVEKLSPNSPIMYNFNEDGTMNVLVECTSCRKNIHIESIPLKKTNDFVVIQKR